MGFRYALSHILDGYPRRQNTRIIYLHPVVIDGNPQRRTDLRIIGMHCSIDGCFMRNGHRNAPDIATMDLRYVHPSHSMFFDKTEGYGIKLTLSTG